MTKRAKKQFVNELIDSVRRTVLQNIDRMPEEWDGHELRCYVADKFIRNVRYGAMVPGNQRYQNYQNTVIVQNL